MNNYNKVLDEFRDWLALLNYEQSTIKYAPLKVSEFISFIFSDSNCDLSEIDNIHFKKFFKYLLRRKNKKTGKKLKPSYIRTYITAIKKFLIFLKKNKGINVNFNFRLDVAYTCKNYYFTRKQINRIINRLTKDVFGLRDRAIIAIFYGCGLRRSEGALLNISDLDLERRILHVKNAKNYKERYIPISIDVYFVIYNYLKYSRPKLCIKKTDSFFVSKKGNRLSGESLAYRFRKLKQIAGIQTKGSLHSLRHSIATHFLEEGINIDLIRQFLGHSTLQSTQVYTHYNQK